MATAIRLWLVLVLALCSAQAWAAAYTSCGSGNWSTPATWNDGILGCGLTVTVPGDGDTVVLNHTVTADIVSVVGTSPADVTTMALTVNTGGILIVTQGVTLTVKGNMYINSGSSGNIKNGVQLYSGSTLIMDASESSNPQQSYVIKSGGYTRYYLHGSAGNYATIKSLTGYGKAVFTQALFNTGNTFDADYAYFLNIGSSGVLGIASYADSTKDPLSTITNSVFDSCGQITQSASTIGSYVIFNNNTVKNPVSVESYALRFYGIVNNTLASQVKNNVLAQGVQMLKPYKFVVTDNYFGGGVGTSGTNASNEFSWGSFSSNFVLRTDATGPGTFDDNLVNSYFCADRKTVNVNIFTFGSSTFPRHATGNIMEHITNSNNGDMIFPTSSNAASKITIDYNILLPNPLGESPGKIVSFFPAAGGNTNLYTDILNNTFVTTGTIVGPLETGIGTGELATGQNDAHYGNHAGMISAFKNNLAWTPTGFAYKGAKLVREQSQMQDMVYASDADYNWGYNLFDGTDGYGYQTWIDNRINSMFSSGTQEAHSSTFTSDPNFVDTTRNFATYDRFGLGHTSVPVWSNGTVYSVGDVISSSVAGYYNGVPINYRCIAAHTSASGDDTRGAPGGVTNNWRTSWEFASHQDLRDDTSRISGLMTWVKSGFTPTNLALKGAASDGGDIGAVAVASPVTNHTAPRRGFGFWRKGFNL